MRLEVNARDATRNMAHCVHWIDVTAVFTMQPVATLREKSSLKSSPTYNIRDGAIIRTQIRAPGVCNQMTLNRHVYTAQLLQSDNRLNVSRRNSRQTRWMNGSRVELDESVFIENVVRAPKDRSILY